MEVKKKKRIGDVPPRLWTVKEYYKLGEEGFFRNERVELLEGVIYKMFPINAPHSSGVEKIARLLRAVFCVGFYVRTQQPLHLGPRSLPQPDVAVVIGQLEDYLTQHPTTALLAVEVSDTTLWYDRHRKAGLYARAGVEDYWLVNLPRRRLEIRRNPIPEASRPYGFTYGSITLHEAADTVTPLAAPGVSIAVADLLP